MNWASVKKLVNFLNIEDLASFRLNYLVYVWYMRPWPIKSAWNAVNIGTIRPKQQPSLYYLMLKTNLHLVSFHTFKIFFEQFLLFRSSWIKEFYFFPRIFFHNFKFNYAESGTQWNTREILTNKIEIWKISNYHLRSWATKEYLVLYILV